VSTTIRKKRVEALEAASAGLGEDGVRWIIERAVAQARRSAVQNNAQAEQGLEDSCGRR